jgi:hypothetical protein
MLQAEFQSAPTTIRHQLGGEGCVLVAPAGLFALTQVDSSGLEGMRSSWGRLPPDGHLRDGGSYRSRRHACFLVEPESANVTRAPHRAHWQPLDYNALHGGIERWFEPIEAEVASAPAWSQLLTGLGRCFSSVLPTPTWFVEAHQFRIDTVGGIGRPTPEGAHRDGVDFVAILMVERAHIKGGETRVFEANGPQGIRFTLTEPFQTLLLDDARVIHETSPIQPIGPDAHRDTLVLTYRSNGFQAPPLP